MKKKKVVFFNQDSGYLMIDIINAYVEAGNKCVLITGRLVERNTPLASTVRFEKIIKYDRSTSLKRILTWGIGFIQMLFKVVFKYRKDSLFIVSNPPFAPLLPLFVNNPFQLLIFDIYPDALSELGYLSEKSIVLKWWRKANRKVFAKAEKIYTITESMKEVLVQYVGNNEIMVVPVWTDNSFLKPLAAADNPFLKTHDLIGKFIVMYSGNIGLSSNIDVILDIAKKIHDKDIVFLIVGEGAYRDKLMEKARSLNLGNTMFLPWQPASQLPFTLSVANIAMIFLGKKASKLAVPSKLYNFLSVGAPILSVSAKNSEVEKVICKYNCGKSFEVEDIEGMVEYIRNVIADVKYNKLLKDNSFKASKEFCKSNAFEFLNND